MAQTERKNKIVWTMQDYGNLNVAQYLYNLNQSSSSGGPPGTVGEPNAGALDRLFPQLNPGVSTIADATGIKPTPQLAATAQEILKDPKAFAQQGAPEGEKSLLDTGKTILSSLFDTSDEADLKIGPVGMAPVESVWDGFLKGFGWVYDRISQVTSAGLSALPGGTRTLTWEEAGNVSVGQMIVANAGVSAGKLRRGEGTAGDVFGAAFLGIPGLGAFIAAQNDPDTAIQQAGFDITSEEDRKVFDSGFEKFFSGVGDFAFTFADPLIGAGAIGKVARIRYIDRPLTSQKAVDTLIQEELLPDIQKLNEIEQSGAVIDNAVLEQLTPVGRFVEESWGGKKSWREIALRDEIKDSTHAEAIAMGIAEARTRDEAAQILAAGTGDRRAIEALQAENASAADLLATAERKKLEIRAALEPQKYKAEVYTYQRRSEIAAEEVGKAKDRYKKGEISREEVERVQQEHIRAMDDYEAIQRGVARDPISLPADSASFAQAQKAVDDVVARNKWVQRALETDGSLRGTNRAFASKGKVQDAISNRRSRRAADRYEVMSTRGTWSPSEFFTKDGFRRTLRVWRYAPGLENPAYYMPLKGTGAIDPSRESGAVMDTLTLFSGEGRVIDVNGVPRTVGGRAEKERILGEFNDAIIRGDDVAKAANAFEQSIQDQIRMFYGLDEDIMDYVVAQARTKMNDMAERIKDPARRWFPEESAPETLATLGRAVFLESQLMEGMYLLPYDELEKILINIADGKVKHPMAGEMSSGSKMLLVEKSLYTKQGLAFERAKAANDIFQSFWRPLVLMRLGYPQRNVTEGLFRSVMFNQSLAPLMWAGRAGAQGFGNTRRAKRAEKAAAKYAQVIKRSEGSDDPYMGLVARQDTLIQEQLDLTNVRYGEPDLPDTYKLVMKPAGKGRYSSADDNFHIVKEDDGWRIYERGDDGEFINGSGAFGSVRDARKVLESQIEKAQRESFDYAANGQPRLAEINRDYGPGKIRSGVKSADIKRQQAANQRRMDEIDQELADIEAQFDALGPRELPVALKGTKFDKWRTSQLQALKDEIDSGAAFEDNFLDEAGGWEALDGAMQEQLIRLRGMRAQLVAQRSAMMKDDYYALSEFTSAAARKRRVDVGDDIMLDNGVRIATAFGNPRYRDLAQKLLSSDNTIKATMSVRANLSQSLWLQKQTEMFVEVYPDMGAAYWDGMQEMLQQYAQSTVGQMVAAGRTDAEIISWLRTEKGRAWISTLDNVADEIAAQYPWGGKIGQSVQQAQRYIETIRESLEYVTLGDPRVLDIITRRPPRADELKRLMGDYDNLNPVVGNKETIVGYPTMMQGWKRLTEKVFEKIGTLPEDVFVRGPFYAKQYERARDDGFRILMEQYKDSDMIPLDRIQALEVQAHRRALKDTKEFLYTIDRRTNLGKYMEWIFPFISATQNSLTAIGKLTRRDPALPAVMLALWRAPTNAGWEDEEGNLYIPLPKQLIPDGVENALGLSGTTGVKFPKSGFNVVFPETGFAFAPRPTPLVQVGASELMKRGLLVDITPPPMMTSFLGEDGANQVWKAFKDYIYGEENGISNMPLSIDKVAPPTANRLVQLIQGQSSSQYAYQYALQARTEELRWRAGERDDYPTSKEIADRTNGQFLLRFLGNAFAFTPPDYQSTLQPLIDMQRMYDKTYGLDGPMKFSQQFGNEQLILANTDTTKNIGGSLSNIKAVSNIKKYGSLIEGLSPRLGNDLSLLGIIVNQDAADAEYDVSAYRWLTTSQIPGTSRNWRELLSGPEAMRESQRTAGWVEYSKFMGSLDSLLNESGYTSYRVKGAAELNQARKEFIENMKNNPLYEGWKIDYEDIGGKKSEKALMVLTTALSDPEFMADKANNRTWQAAAMYIEGRNEIVRLVAETGKTINHSDNAYLAEQWDAFRLKLKNFDNGWSAIANRYLNSDDDPREFANTASVFQEGM